MYYNEFFSHIKQCISLRKFSFTQIIDTLVFE